MDFDLLDDMWRCWGTRTATLTEQEWQTPTRLSGWVVQDLVAHVAPNQAVLDFLRRDPVQNPKVTSGAEMLRRFNAPGGAAIGLAEEIADQARAAATAGPEKLCAQFTEFAPQLVETLRSQDSSAGLDYPLLRSATFGAIGETSLIEATVHYLDLIDAVGGPPPPPAALRATATILAAVADPTEFIEAATGRTDSPLFPVMR
ncbi:maleylpyruvate isomerase N-terminal domain-containing protein [Nocardia vermiculata]|uniref:Maleylpyruvate isomerase family protein n=1 Tax=Nocardia vermiculata TaxID=257274 RepID=A0A846Y413_9NOCA|nr:maleylpyruvate isomerase N-terminal domain-containing protein [Nocardia vermiculata]NKY52431.1 maleylpyruvate isomerase family protein [Nocardia vermiculata]